MILEVVGIESNNTPDDNVFYRCKTLGFGWFSHGHNEVTRKDALNQNAKDGENLEATAISLCFQRLQKTIKLFHLMEIKEIAHFIYFTHTQRTEA